MGTHHFLRGNSLVLSLVAALSLASCAKEQSAEERERELRERKIERLSKAEGKYLGQVATARETSIPFALVVSVNRNPEQNREEPGLTVHMRLGLLGGVDLTTTKVSFDHGSSYLTASFEGSSSKGGAPSGAGGASKALELRAKVTSEGLSGAKLVAASGNVYDVTAKSAKDLSLAEPGVELTYGIRLRHVDAHGPVDAMLSLTRRSGDLDAPASSDMPRMPQIDAALRFPGVSSVAHVATSIQYDALRDHLELYFAGGNGLRLAFSSLSDTGAGSALTFTSEPHLEGVIELGSRRVGTVELSPDQLHLIERTKKSPTPAHNYTGFYENTVGQKFVVVANAVYTGTEGSSGTATPMDRFPKMSLQASICIDRQPFSRKKLVLASVDYLTSQATFVEENNVVERLYATFTDAWEEIEIEIPDQDGGSKRTKLHLTATDVSDRDLTCADAPSAETTLTKLFGLTEDEDVLEFYEDDPPSDTPFFTYEGYMTRGGRYPVPVSLAVFPRRDPDGSDEPSLQVTARIGFFGGSNLASQTAIFNWGSGRITASFPRPNGAPLELRGVLDPETLHEAVLIGPNLGQNTLVVKSGTQPYVPDVRDTVLNTAMNSGDGPVDPSDALRGVLTLRSRAEGTPAPANIDLPVLPSIDASLRLDGLGQTPQLGQRVIYDVLRGTIEIFFSESSVLEFTNVFLEPTGDAARPYRTFSELTGRLILGGQALANAVAVDVTSGGRWNLRDLPYTIYIGRYQGAGSTNYWKALARVDYPGNAGSNTAEYPFLTFPNLHMTVTLCLGSSAFSRRELELESVDYLNRLLVFKNRGTGARHALEIAFEPGWNTLAGEFRDTDGSSGDTRGSMINLTALPNANSIDCSTPLPNP